MKLKNPYPEYIVDEYSGIKVKNNNYLIWQEAAKQILKELTQSKDPKLEYVDITENCRTELRKSGHSSGYYSAIMHDDTLVAALGFGRTTPINVKKGYKIEKPEDSTVSFRVYKLNK